jgi:hypothetical protein
MAEVLPILSAVSTAIKIIDWFVTAVDKYQRVARQLSVAKTKLRFAEFLLEAWRRRYDVREERLNTYYETLFSSECGPSMNTFDAANRDTESGWLELRQCLGHVDMIHGDVKEKIENMVHGTVDKGGIIKRNVRYRSEDNEMLVKESIRTIKKSMGVARRFYSVLSKDVAELQADLVSLLDMIDTLSKFSELLSEKEYSKDLGSQRHVPGKKALLAIEYSSEDGTDIQRNAKALRNAFEAGGGGLNCCIALAVPKSPRECESRLYRGVDGNMQLLIEENKQLVVKPVKIRSEQDRPKVPSSISAAAADLGSRGVQNRCLLAPGAPLDEAFEMIISPALHLRNMNLRLSSLLRPPLNSLPLSLQDTIALSVSLSEGCFRLLGSAWLHDLDVLNIRSGKGEEGKWMTLLQTTNDGKSGDVSTRRALDSFRQKKREGRSRRDIGIHCQIFRLGLILTELALRKPITYIQEDEQASAMNVVIEHIDPSKQPVSAEKVAMRVKAETASDLLADMTYFCLSVLESDAKIRDERIGDKFYSEVLIPQVTQPLRSGHHTDGFLGH